MRLAFSLSVPLSLFAAGILAGCQSEPTSPQSGATSVSAGVDARQQAYARELYALKMTIADQKTLEAKHLELLSKYGYPLPERETEPAAGTASPSPDLPALAKAASTKLVLVKQATGTIYRTFEDYVDLPDQSTLSLTVTAWGAADPSLVAYYYKSQNAIQFVLAKDDDSTSVSNPLNPGIAEWKNNTGAALRVYYTVFAALTSARGLGDLTVAIDGQKVDYPEIRIGGTVQYQDDFPSTAPAGCQANPTSSRFNFKVNSGTNTVQLLAYAPGGQSGVEGSATSTGTGIFSAVIPSGTSKTISNSFVLMSRSSTTIGNQTISGGYTYSQYDQFSCN